MELTNKIGTLTIGDVYEQTLAVFRAELPPIPPRVPGYDNRNGLKHKWVPKDQNESQQRPGRDNEHKPVGLQRQDVQLDLQKKAGRDCVGTAQSSGVQHGPLQTCTVLGIPQLRGGRDLTGTEMDPAKGGSPRAHAGPARKTKRYSYDADRHEWVYCQET